MKFKKRLSIDKNYLFFTIVVIIFLLFFQNNLKIESKADNNESSKEPLKTSAIYPVSKLFIDDSNPSWNWSVFASTHSEDLWFSGTGTFSDPYKIELVYINGPQPSSASCIEVRNSNANFLIINCDLRWAGGQPYTAGVRLENVKNGKIINNYCNYSTHGISLVNSQNNTLSGNTLINNYDYGINLENSHNNTLFNNFASSNDYGIALDQSIENEIEENKLESNDEGIYLYNSDNNEVSQNTAISNQQYGINLAGNSDENSIIGNNVSFNHGYQGIYSRDNERNNISGNFIYSNNKWGIKLDDSNYNIISGNTLKNNVHYGIFIEESGSNNMSGNHFINCGFNMDGAINLITTNDIDSSNLVNSKPLYVYSDETNLKQTDFSNAGQVMLVNCDNSLISNLDISNGTTGIILKFSRNNTISNVISFNNSLYGILLDESHNNTVIDCITNNNGDEGIYLYYSTNCTLKDNEANRNRRYLPHFSVDHQGGNGIVLYHSHYNVMIGNTLSRNEYYGIYLRNSMYNLLSKSLVNNNNQSGIYLNRGGYNNVSENTIESNPDKGVVIETSSFNYIKENQITDNHYGLHIVSSETWLYFHGANIISGNHFTSYDEDVPIRLFHTDSNIITKNIIEGVRYGIYLTSSSNTSILENQLTGIVDSIRIYYSSYCEINNNTIIGPGTTSAGYPLGIDFLESHYCRITGNEISGVLSCFYEADCVGNIFEDNVCNEFTYGPPPDYIIYIIIGCIAGGAVVTVVLIKRKLGR